eukprot:g49750.t1
MPERAEVGVKRSTKRCPKKRSGGATCRLGQGGNTPQRAPLKLESLITAKFHLEIEVASDNAKFGFVEFAEKWNGRMAMLGFTIGLATEAVTGSGILKQLGL